MFIGFNFYPVALPLLLYLAVACGGTCSILLAGGLTRRLVPADSLIALYPLLTEAWAGHDFDVLHAFVFLAVAVGGAELLSRGLLIGPASASRARAAGNDGRRVSRFNNNLLWRRNAVKLAHHGGTSVFFLHFFYFLRRLMPAVIINSFVSRGLSFLSGIIYDKYFV